MKNENERLRSDTEADTFTTNAKVITLKADFRSLEERLRAGSGLTCRSRDSAQVPSLESKAEALRRLGCGDGGVRVDSMYIDNVLS
jgi:hypothetical protein